MKVLSPSGPTRFLGSSYEVGPTGTATKYVFAGSQRIAAKDAGGAPRFYHGDHLGSSNVITDGTGALVELAEYRPYGALARREGSVEVPQKFTGQRLDPTGFYFYQARYYDPSLGRFLQADPVVPSPGDLQALNRYNYVRNNPLKYTDPTGHGWFSKFWRSIVGIAAAAISFFVPPLAPAMWALNTGIGVATAIQTGNVGGFVGSLVGGAVFGAIGQQVGLGISTALGDSAYTFLGGALSGAVEFGVAGFGSGFGGALASGASLGDAVEAGGYGTLAGAATGAAIQGSYMAGWQDGLHGNSIEQVVGAQGRAALQANDPGRLAGVATRLQARTHGKRSLFLHGTDYGGARGILSSPGRQLYDGSWLTLPHAFDPVTGKVAINLNAIEYQRFATISPPKGEWFALVVAPQSSTVWRGFTAGGAPQFQVYGTNRAIAVFPNPND